MNSRMSYFNNQYEPQQAATTSKASYFQLYQKNSSFTAVKFILECCNKLEAKPSTFAFAATIFHRVNNNLIKSDYDKFSLATGALYLATKVNEDPFRLKDIINVSQVTLDRDAALSQLGNDAWILSVRDTIVQCELFIMRVLHFDPSVKLPHPYLINYCNTLEMWLDDEMISQIPVTQCTVSLLQDFYSNPAIVDYAPEHVACACLALTCQIYGIRLPGSDDADTWYKAFCPDISIERLWEIIDQILKVYEYEVDLN